MKKLAILLAAVLLPAALFSQVVIDLSMYNETVNTQVSFTVCKAGTKEGIPYVSAYAIPVRDTIVTHFAISDKDGYVVLSDVPRGKYEINVEMLGYKPFRKEYSIGGWEMNLGRLELEEDPEFIDAARVTANVDPVTVVKDTLIYNAAAFRVGETAMLEDLLKMMPGMSVDDQGNVTVNGEKVDKITVGGKTFFFDDPSMTLKNLPARFVDKIKVMDRNSHEADMTGIESRSDKEKVMDVELKEEYRQGTFGNVNALAGTSASSGDEQMLRENPGLLFNASGMLASYNEKDQLTVLGNGKNADVPGSGGAVLIISDDDEVDVMAGKSGVTTTAQAGANYNTSRIKGVDTDVSASYTYSSKDSRQRTQRLSFLDEGDNLESGSDFVGNARDGRMVVNASMSKCSGKFEFAVRPSLSYVDSDRATDTRSTTSGNSGLVNEGWSTQVSDFRKLRLNTSLYMGLRNMGKEGRNIMFSGAFASTWGNGSSSELSWTGFGSGTSDERNLNYARNTGSFSGYGRVAYTEPFTEKLSMNVSLRASSDSYSSDKDATNGEDGSRNEYYSTYSRRYGDRFVEALTLQYKFNEDNRVIMGMSAFQTSNVTVSEALGASRTVGEGEWTNNWAPSLELGFGKGNFRGHIEYSGQTSLPSGESVVPAIDISNPLMVTAGNIYLAPSFSHDFSGGVSFSLPKKGLSLFLEGYGNVMSNSEVPAVWFDPEGVRYSVNVNAKDPVSNISGYFSFSSPLGAQRLFNLSLDVNYMRWVGVSYQAAGRLDGLDKDNYSYQDMMSWFWGDSHGDRFYSGESGFVRSKTSNTSYNNYISLSFRKGGFYAYASCALNNRTAKYSLDGGTDMKTWDITPSLKLGYTSEKGLDFSFNGKYYIYRGYSSGMDDENLILNLSLSKTFKGVTLLFHAVDLLDRSNSYRRAVTAEYREDTIGNTLGRFFLAGVSFSFGKMNARNNSTAQNAMINMLY